MQKISVPESTAEATQGERIALVIAKADDFIEYSQNRSLSKRELAYIATLIDRQERPYIRGGVNFSRHQSSAVLLQRDQGTNIEFETLGPYLANYIADNGIMSLDNLTPEDAIGLQLAATFRAILPTARLVSLYDDYNATAADGGGSLGVGDFGVTAVANFRQSLVALFKAVHALSPDAREDEAYILVSEASKIVDAEALVDRLDSVGKIRRQGEEIVFVNTDAENPLHRKFHLRTKKGKWLCPALDAATFLKQENLEICHIIVLPDYMKGQQDKVWELLRVFNFTPQQYHNIFYDPTLPPAYIARVILQEFQMHTA